MPDTKQILITIKKPDGTLAKVTMAEFKAMQSKKTEVKHQHQTHKAVEHHLKHKVHPTHHQAHHIQHPKKKMTREDASSLLEEKPLPRTSEVPVLKPAKPPAVATPFNSFVHSKNVPVAPDQKRQEVVSQFTRQDVASEPIFKLNSQPIVKKFVSDIAHPLPQEMSPVDEIRSTTLVDFRRLSDKPKESAHRLQQKMFNLQDESFVLYLEALDAYRASPLYQEYAQSICEALANRRSLATQLAEKKSLKLEEAIALMEMEKEL